MMACLLAVGLAGVGRNDEEFDEECLGHSLHVGRGGADGGVQGFSIVNLAYTCVGWQFESSISGTSCVNLVT